MIIGHFAKKERMMFDEVLLQRFFFPCANAVFR